MRVTDELKHRNKLIQLSFVDFLEALLRVACVKRMPTDEQMAKVSKLVGWWVSKLAYEYVSM